MAQTNLETMISSSPHDHGIETSSDSEECGSERFTTLSEMEEDEQRAGLLKSGDSPPGSHAQQPSRTPIRRAGDLESQTGNIQSHQQQPPSPPQTTYPAVGHPPEMSEDVRACHFIAAALALFAAIIPLVAMFKTSEPHQMCDNAFFSFCLAYLMTWLVSVVTAYFGSKLVHEPTLQAGLPYSICLLMALFWAAWIHNCNYAQTCHQRES